MKLTRRISLVVMGLLGLVGLSACSPITLLNAVSRDEAGVRQVAQDLAYAPGPRHHLDIFAPKGQGPFPILFFIYGGSWAEGEKESYGFVGQAFAAQGFLTVIADYRLVPQVRFPGFVEDGALALKWVEDNAALYGGDLDRLFIAGHSAGAYNASMLALDRRYLDAVGFKTPIRAMAGLSGPYDFYPFDVKASIDAFGKAPDPAQTQPITFAGKDSPPMVLLTGDADSIVARKNTDELAARLVAAGVEVETHFYPGQEHADPLIALGPVFRGKNSALSDVVSFFKRHGSGRQLPHS